MFTKLHNHFGIPGVIAVVALVFAMLGGAYAASGSDGGNATASAKGKQGPRGKRGPKGATGPAGPTGPAGAPGAKGDTGAQGPNGATGANGADGEDGTDGTNGTSVKVKPLTVGLQVACEETGGALVEEDKTGGVKVEVCNGEQGEDGEPGEKGEPWTPNNTLPPDATLTGTWSFNATTADGTLSSEVDGPTVYAPISFPIRLASGLTESKVHYQSEGDFATNCPGSVTDPTAAEGHLCVYVTGANVLNATPAVIFEFAKPFWSLEGSPGEASPAGTVLVFKVTGNPASGFGSWAVTGF